MNSRVTINLQNFKPCPKMTLKKFIWDSQRSDEGMLYYYLKNNPKLKIIRMYIISNAGIGKIILNDDIPKPVCAGKLTKYQKISRTICVYVENELRKLAEMLTLEKPCYVADPPISSSEF